MAVAPVNKFLSVVVPVAPGEQKIYEVPTGVSSIVLYAQVANVGVGTYPTVTLIHRRESRSTGNTRDIRIIKDIEIPPNDAAILVEGRLVLEKTATTLDRLYIKGNQSGVVPVTNVDYNYQTGIATVTTKSAHNFSAGDDITMSNVRFTCVGSTPVTTNLFPDPQQSYSIDTIIDSTSFTSVIGTNPYDHTYQPAEYTFIRSRQDSIVVTYSATDPPVVGATFTPTDAVYNPSTGVLTLTVNNHGFNNDPNDPNYPDTIRLVEESLIFTCTSDNNLTEKSYPRSTDPAGGNVDLDVTVLNDNEFSVNVGSDTSSGYVAPLQMEFTGSILENSTS